MHAYALARRSRCFIMEAEPVNTLEGAGREDACWLVNEVNLDAWILYGGVLFCETFGNYWEYGLCILVIPRCEMWKLLAAMILNDKHIPVFQATISIDIEYNVSNKLIMYLIYYLLFSLFNFTFGHVENT
jgi:hypothetical protein